MALLVVVSLFSLSMMMFGLVTLVAFVTVLVMVIRMMLLVMAAFVMMTMMGSSYLQVIVMTPRDFTRVRHAVRGDAHCQQAGRR